MIHFDRSQPTQDVTTPRYDYAPGLFIRQVLGNSWEVINVDGQHLRYLVAQSIDYESTIGAEILKARGNRQ